jgi:hypothetical protein
MQTGWTTCTLDSGVVYALHLPCRRAFIVEQEHACAAPSSPSGAGTTTTNFGTDDAPPASRMERATRKLGDRSLSAIESASPAPSGAATPEAPTETTAPTAPLCAKCRFPKEHPWHDWREGQMYHEYLSELPLSPVAPVASPATPAPNEVIRWVVVRDGIIGGLEYYAHQDLRGRHATWSSNHARAFRFASYDAAVLRAGQLDDDCRVEEHMWIDVPRESASPATPTPATQPPKCDSGTYGELPDEVRPLVIGHEWDNMNRAEQRTWAIDRLASSQQEVERLRAALEELKAIYDRPVINCGWRHHQNAAHPPLITKIC